MYQLQTILLIGPDELVQNAAHETGQMLRIILRHTAMSAKEKIAAYASRTW
jgi:hypothetical protein